MLKASDCGGRSERPLFLFDGRIHLRALCVGDQFWLFGFGVRGCGVRNDVAYSPPRGRNGLV